MQINAQHLQFFFHLNFVYISGENSMILRKQIVYIEQMEKMIHFDMNECLGQTHDNWQKYN